MQEHQYKSENSQFLLAILDDTESDGCTAYFV